MRASTSFRPARRPASGPASWQAEPAAVAPGAVTLGDVAPAGLEQATGVLAAAFRDNPLNRAVIGEPPERRLRCNRAGSRASLEVAIGRAIVRGAWIGGALQGVLVALPAARSTLPLPSLVGQLRVLWAQGWRVSERWNRAHFELRRCRPAEPHAYLDVVGVAPAAWRTGVGSALLADWLARVDADGVPSYLETDRSENRTFYRRAGFETIAEECILGVRVWRMWRPTAGGSVVGPPVAGRRGSEGGGSDVR